MRALGVGMAIPRSLRAVRRVEVNADSDVETVLKQALGYDDVRQENKMGKRIITTESLEEDLKIENHLRPPTLLTDYIGQEKAKRCSAFTFRQQRNEAPRVLLRTAGQEDNTGRSLANEME